MYGLGVRARNTLYDRGTLRALRLEGPVVSIGNLSVGGSGKTPFVLLLGELLKQRGLNFDVLSRGYGRKSRGVALVNPNGTAREFGDEPLLIARRLGVPVIVGEDRYQAGKFAEQKFGAQIHLLDDGFQHRSLARDFDIVLVMPEDADDRLLPGGRLREPLSALHRADALVLPAATSPEVSSLHNGSLSSLHNKEKWRVQRGVVLTEVPKAPVVFCGIARPENFVLQLQAAGITPAATEYFRDHHAYNQNDIRDLLGMRRAHNAGGFITTEKDVINLGAFVSAFEPLAVARVRMELLNAASALDFMMRTIEERKRHEKIPLT